MGKNETLAWDKYMIAQYPGLPSVLIIRLSGESGTREVEGLVQTADILTQNLVKFILIDTNGYPSVSAFDVMPYKSKLRELFENTVAVVINMPKGSIADFKMVKKFAQTINVELHTKASDVQQTLADMRTRNPELASIMEEYFKGTEPKVLIDLLKN